MTKKEILKKTKKGVAMSHYKLNFNSYYRTN